MNFLDLHVIWYALVGILLTGYAILDGFDLGVGVPGFGAWRGLAHVWMKQHGFV